MFRQHQLAFIRECIKDLEKMRKDLSLRQKYVRLQTDMSGEVQKSVPGAQCSNGSGQKASLPSKHLSQCGYHSLFSKAVECNMRGKREFPGRDRGRIRVLGDMLKTISCSERPNCFEGA